MQDLERQENILKYLKVNHTATVEFLSKNFYASPSTIRRDLNKLEETGVVHRTHGGVVYNDKLKEVSILIRQNENLNIKNSLCELAAKYIPDFDSIFIDNSSTCLPIIKIINLNKKLVVTNSFLAVREIKSLYDAKVIFLGGDFDLSNLSTSGNLTIDSLNQFHFDLCVQSCASVFNGGVYENEYITASFKKIARFISTKRILVFDKTKIDKNASCRSGNLSDFDYIISDIDDEQKETLLKEHPQLRIYNS